MTDPNQPVQYLTRRERRAAERAAEEAARGAAPSDPSATDASDVDADGVAFGAGAALTREEYEARMAELSGEAGEHAVSLSRHGVSTAPATAHGEHEGAEHAGPEHVDPQVRAEQEALAARAAALNAAQRGTPAGPAVTDAPVASDLVPPVELTEPHNLGAVTPLRYQNDPAFDFPTLAPPSTSMLFLTVDPETGTAQPLPGTPGAPADAVVPTTPDHESDAAPGPATGWVPTADLLESGATASSSPAPASPVSASDVEATTPSSISSAPPLPVGAADAAGLDPLDSRTARQGRRPWVAALIGTSAIVVVGLAVLAAMMFLR
ncbi:hypothetical protein GCM10011512_09740 [Tersicoccus solisilvae]|uniref:Uncharacterized protein n=1 Tax=Tersicoccus solisilvae TaxID=1882339 RepID=A0ABQ1NTH6_9MICC|nr:hypothetical protein [Tersicoccus solisilvae]GGC84932.1 hypothetical protein GCM10011512_09740 [Tersicoccus solisilvae]